MVHQDGRKEKKKIARSLYKEGRGLIGRWKEGKEKKCGVCV